MFVPSHVPQSRKRRLTNHNGGVLAAASESGKDRPAVIGVAGREEDLSPREEGGGGGGGFAPKVNMRL